MSKDCKEPKKKVNSLEEETTENKPESTSQKLDENGNVIGGLMAFSTRCKHGLGQHHKDSSEHR